MSLPVSEQRVLDRIENALEGGEPRLRSMFAIFTRLTRDDAVPPTETLRARTRLRLAWPDSGVTATTMRAIIAVPVILGLITLCIFMAINSSGAQGCRPAPVLARTVSCQSAPGSAGSSASHGG
ncbi:MAG TPA: hypothetical protein VKU77_30980 [Streptosporangiaceae bacterium]|nr:hypothetical protein [Streptosporangiaceae bacterium]